MLYDPAANSMTEAFNKTIIKLHQKFVSSNQQDWDKKIGECLWAYWTVVCTSTKTTPFFLVYGSEVVLPFEIQISSLQVALATKMAKEEKHQWWLQELEALNEKCL